MIIKGRFYGGELKSKLPHRQIPDSVLSDLKDYPVVVDFGRTIGKVIQTWLNPEDGWWWFKAEVSRIPASRNGIALHWEYIEGESDFKIQSISLIDTPADPLAVIVSRRRTIK